MILVSLFLIITLILFIMVLANLLLSKKMFKNREKSSPFECGFDPVSLNRAPFSLQFYLISIIFLIFDVEIALILPMIKTVNYLEYMIMMNLIFIMLILLVGLFIEWIEGALNWFK